ncbi:unnamed protein product [Absidia cylindrospora]
MSFTGLQNGIHFRENRRQLINAGLKRNQPRPLSALEPQLVKYGQQNIARSPITRRPLTSSTTSNCLARHSMYSFSLHYSKLVPMYQPQLENHHYDDLSQKQMNRLSNQYSSYDTIQKLLQHTPSLTSKLSSLSSSSSEQSNDSSSNITNNPPMLSPTESLTSDYQFPISPPLTSPASSSTSLPSPNISTLEAILPKESGFDYPSVTHIQKKTGMRLRSFLHQCVVLNKTIRLDQHTLASNPAFFKGSDEQTGQAKAILKLSIVKLSATHSEHSVMAPFGIGFINSAQARPRENSGSTANMSNYASVPDSLVMEALDVWLSRLYLPNLSHASHIMRVGIKLYIVFDISIIP